MDKVSVPMRLQTDSARTLARPLAFDKTPAPCDRVEPSKFDRSQAQASVAQLDRASVFGTEGWGFESLRVYFSAFGLTAIHRSHQMLLAGNSALNACLTDAFRP